MRTVLQSAQCSSAQATQLLHDVSSIPVAPAHPVYHSCNACRSHVREYESAFSAATCLIPLQAYPTLARVAVCALRTLSLCNRAQKVHTGKVCLQVRELPPYEAKPKKPASEIVTYANEFLLKFSEVSVQTCPEGRHRNPSACSCFAEACLSVVCCTPQCCVCPVHGGACHLACMLTAPWPLLQSLHRYLVLPDVSILLLAVS